MKSLIAMVFPFLLCFFILTACTHMEKDLMEEDLMEKNSTYKQITMNEAVSVMANETDYIILDVRTTEEFASGHIPGAVNIPNESIGAEEIPSLPDKDQLILVYCRSGNRSKQAARKLVNLGYTNIVEFGGIMDWPGEIATE